jgi:hypothetical protein
MQQAQTTMFSRVLASFKLWSKPAEADAAQADTAEPTPSIYARPNFAPKVAGFLQRIDDATPDLSMLGSANVQPRPLSVLMTPAAASTVPMRTIPLFLVPKGPDAAQPTPFELPLSFALPVSLPVSEDEPTQTTLFAAPRLRLVVSAEEIEPAAEAAAASPAPAAFHLPARLASVAYLNTPDGRRPARNPAKLKVASTKAPARPAAQKPVPVPAAKNARRGNAKPAALCFVRTQANGKCSVAAVPKRAKRASR